MLEGKGTLVKGHTKNFGRGLLTPSLACNIVPFFKVWAVKWGKPNMDKYGSRISKKHRVTTLQLINGIPEDSGAL